jgi:hypothetical protein
MPVGTIHGARELCAGELPDRADLLAEKIFLISDFRFKISGNSRTSANFICF